MTALTLRAHFDGKQILLDEPYDLKAGTPLAITILPERSDLEKSEWIGAAQSGLARAYADDEPEYTAADIKE